MEIEPHKTSQEPDPFQKVKDSPISSYTRLPLLRFNLWQLLMLVLTLIAVAFLVFPRQKMLVDFYWEKGMSGEAIAELYSILEKNPDDIPSLIRYARINQEVGEIDRAIATLEKAAKNSRENPEILKQLALYYEWSRLSREALEVWERLADLEPENLSVLRRLIDYYRYFEQPENEGDAVARLVRLEKKLLPVTPFMQIREGTHKNIIFRDPLVSALTRVMEDLSETRISGASDPFSDELLVRLYVIRLNYVKALDPQNSGPPPDTESTIIRALELFVITGRFDRGYDFAAGLDMVRNQDVGTRLKLAAVMRWNGLHDKALALLSKLHEDQPQNVEILAAMAEAAGNTDSIEIALNAYEKLTAFHPELEEFWVRLGDLYLTARRPKKAYPIFRARAEEYGEKREAVEKMLEVAGMTEDREIIADALSSAGALRPDDPDLQVRMGEMYLWIERPEKAYPIFRTRAEEYGGRREAVEKMLEVAGMTEDREIIRDALSSAGALRPDDPNLQARMGEMYLWIERPGKAYDLYRRLVAVEGGKKNIDQMIQAAEATGKGDLLLEAARIAQKRVPGDARISRRVAEALLAQGREKEAIGAYLNYLKLRPGDEKVMRKLALLYQWNDQPREAAQIIMTLAAIRPGDRNALEEAARIAEGAGLSEKAYGLFKTLHEQYPDDPVVTDHLIRLASWTNRGEEAALFLGERSDLDKTDFKKAWDAGKAFIEANRLKEGIFYLERAADLKPGTVPLMRSLAEAYQWAGLNEKMTAQLEALDAMDRLEEEEKLLLAEAYLNRGQGQKALKHLEPFLNLEVLPKIEGMMLARAYGSTGRRNAALRVYKRLGRDHSEDPNQLADLGNQALWLDQHDLALRFYETALRKDPGNLIALKGSAQAYAWNNDAQRAIKRFEEYNRLNPGDFEARYQLGELYFANQRRGEAFREYKKALALMNGHYKVK